MTNDLKGMTRKQLEKLLNDVKKALQSAQARDRREARKAAEKAASEFGFSLEELNEHAPKKSAAKRGPKKARKPSKAKYANPQDSKQTWTGKGRKPNWFIDATKAGIDPAAMEIS